MIAQEIIRAKRDGSELAAEDIGNFVRGIADSSVSEGQAAAFAMATCIRGMNVQETASLTAAMRDSGEVLAWPEGSPIVDKHSTGGVGDKLSLALAPLAACSGLRVPMISGRGLGHTGGTLDKLDAIPGYRTSVDVAQLRKAVEQAGCAIVGATAELAPADRRLYAIRDVTATVDSIPLIVASILSKKLAAGIEALVLDVKCGSGAFMQSADDARGLAEALVQAAQAAGLPAVALITDMNQPIGQAAGNAVEVREAVDLLCSRPCCQRMRRLTEALCAEMLVLGRSCASGDDAAAQFAEQLSTGAAAENFARMVAALGGPKDFVEHPDKYLPIAPVAKPAHAQEEGTVIGCDARAIGMAVVELGGGRKRPGDAVNPAVGFTGLAGLGSEVGPDRPLALVHAQSEDDADRAIAALRAAYRIGQDENVPSDPVFERVAGGPVGKLSA